MLQGKTVIVTGVGSGLGRECVTAALREGANVVMAARTKETLEATAAEVDPSGRARRGGAADITDADSCAALVARARERFGSVDALIQVAAFEYVFGGLHETKLDDWRTAFETNVLGALTVLRPVATAMKDERWWCGRADRLAVDVQAVAAAGRLRRVEGRAAEHDVLPRRRARRRQHPLQHGRAVVDVGPARPDVRRGHREAEGHLRRRRRSTTSSATSRSRA